jgi:glucose dehydrogenase
MTVPITRSVGQFRTEDSTDPVWLSRWLRLLLAGASLTLNPALAAAQNPTVPAAAAPPDDGQWTMPAKNYAAARYSTLDEISSANVKNLQVVFAFSTGVDHGQEAAPIVANNTMYIVTPYPNILFALDLTKPGAPIKWSYRPHPAAASQGVACCDVVNRGAVTRMARSSSTRSTTARSRWTQKPASCSGRPNSAISTLARRSPWRRWS